MDLNKYLRYTKSDFNNLSYIDLAEVAYNYMTAYKNAKYNRIRYNNSLEAKIDHLTKQVNELNDKIDNNKDFQRKYNKIKFRKLTFKERLHGKIIEKDN